MFPTKFRFILPSCFRGEESETRIPYIIYIYMATMFVNGSGQTLQSLERTFHRCFLLSFTSLAEGFQRRRLKCEKLMDDRQHMTDDGRQVMAKAHIAFGKVS